MNEVFLHVGGMNCTACAEKIQTVLAKVDGVEAAQVTVDDGRAAVSYDAEKTTPDALAEAINTQTKFTARVGE